MAMTRMTTVVAVLLAGALAACTRAAPVATPPPDARPLDAAAAPTPPPPPDAAPVDAAPAPLPPDAAPAPATKTGRHRGGLPAGVHYTHRCGEPVCVDGICYDDEWKPPHCRP